MARYLALLLCLSVFAGCAAPPENKAPESLKPDPNAPMASETASKSPATIEEVKTVLDLEEYPGSTVVENNRLSSPQFSPDEARFELSRKSSDPASKVVAYYEDKLQVKATGAPGKQEVWGRTKRGNFVRAMIENDGNGSKYSLSVISYTK